VEALYVALDKKRRAEFMRWRDICEETGISPSTFSRMAYGGAPDVHNLARMLTWLGSTDLGPFIAVSREA
jgi:transcriptional regulator with XRE-family HTH domain